jgi:hypothetical protein
MAKKQVRHFPIKVKIDGVEYEAKATVTGTRVLWASILFEGKRYEITYSHYDLDDMLRLCKDKLSMVILTRKK